MARTRVRWGRVLLLVTVLLGGGGALAQAAGGAAQPVAQSRATHVVRPGDTLWRLARRAVGPEGDPRPMVESIREANGLGSSALVPGTRLILP